jgi:hypothetical protein
MEHWLNLIINNDWEEEDHFPQSHRSTEPSLLLELLAKTQPKERQKTQNTRTFVIYPNEVKEQIE